jgi:N6-adenosine-specific RNA methylase IME4
MATKSPAWGTDRVAVRGDPQTAQVAAEPERHPARTGPLLSKSQRTRLLNLERKVEAGLETVIEVACALSAIRDEGLHRETHDTFEQYVRDRFGIARRTAYGYLEGAKVLANVPHGTALSLSHLRVLAPLAPAEQRELASEISDLSLADARRVIKTWRASLRTTQANLPPPPPLPAGTFRTICADPPWRFEGNDRGDGLAADQFPTMATEDIADIPVPALAAPASHLYLWVPASKVPDAVSVCDAWGFRYVGLLTWVKPGLGLGRYFRMATEHIIFGVRGSLMTRPNLRSYFEAPRGRHSQKPAEFYELVELASPGPYVELFARRPREGWTVWGNEI